ncbi:MAG: DUF1553 domain-containing protein, partial [Planctomycetota bacterium]
WIWSDASASGGRPAGEAIVLRRSFALPALPRRARAVITADNEYDLLVNGRPIAADSEWPSVEVVDLGPHLVPGENEIRITARNHGSSPNPAGVFFEAVLAGDDDTVTTIASDARWQCLPEADPDEGWRPAAALESQQFLGAEVNRRIDAALAGLRRAGGPAVRASLVRADPLMRALGRPGREQVVSRRPDRLTTLQALQVTNGRELGRMLAAGAGPLRNAWADDDALVEHVYLALLSRRPTSSERSVAADVLATGDGTEGIEDLLWIVLMLPEFQLVP